MGDFDDAVQQVTLLTSAAEFPAVSQAAVEQIVHRSARRDRHGLLPDDDEWTPTYDLNAACATVFEVKAANIANRFDMSVDGQSLSRSQMVDHFAGMARMYRNRTAGVLAKEPPSQVGMFADD
jgi:hypothetical protein